MEELDAEKATVTTEATVGKKHFALTMDITVKQIPKRTDL